MSIDAFLDQLYQQEKVTKQPGKLFEKVILKILTDYDRFDRFDKIYSWKQWTDEHPEYQYTGQDIGIDLVGLENQNYANRGGWCAIQCKFYRPDNTIDSKGVDSFLAASSNPVFSSRMLFTTGKLTKNSQQKIKQASPACQVVGRAGLNDYSINYQLFLESNGQKFQTTKTKKQPWPHQEKALVDIEVGLKANQRGRVIMPCGTGKTLVGLWAAEKNVAKSGTILCLVPSIALISQMLANWRDNQNYQHRYLAICSDKSVSKRPESSDDLDLLEIPIPVSTKAAVIATELQRPAPENGLKIIFSTYQSLKEVAKAITELQNPNFKFDLIVCDEAHRTTGISDKNQDTSSFLLVHNNQAIPATKRLYLTATERIFTEKAKHKLQQNQDQINYDCFSMDDKETFGPIFHELTFKQAIDAKLLSDYEILVIGVSDNVSRFLADDLNILLQDLNDRAYQDDRKPKKYLVNYETAIRLMGCWDALADPETYYIDTNRPTGVLNENNHLKSAIVFSKNVASSKALARSVGNQDGQSNSLWQNINKLTSQQPRWRDKKFLQIEIEHVDGTTPASERSLKLRRLKETKEGTCKILTNARVLGEGVDVPALDAIVFLAGKKSIIDIVQAVGRVMRRAPGKDKGYIVIPVFVPEGQTMTDKETLNSEEFQTIWSTIKALRSHDERVSYWVNNPNTKIPMKIVDLTGVDSDKAQSETSSELDTAPIQRRLIEISSNSEIASLIVEKCGDRKMWPKWGKKAATICQKIQAIIQQEVNRSPQLQASFTKFHQSLKEIIHDNLTKTQIVEMLAQHIITKPIFENLFRETSFKQNPISQNLDRIITTCLPESKFAHELQPLDRAYKTMGELIAENVDTKQKVELLRQIYDGFFKEAMPTIVRQLGIVYTPVEIVDKILTLTDQICHQELQKRLTDNNLHILEPFAGTGTFLYRLLTIKDDSGQYLIKDQHLKRKFNQEIHGNEIVLLAYYVAILKIASALETRGLPSNGSFPGMVFGNTFLTKASDNRLLALSDENQQRFHKQTKSPIQVIISNPPWLAGKKSASDEFNLNFDHSDIQNRIKETYGAKHRQITNKPPGGNAMGNDYLKAIRWASDRLKETGDRGIISFVHPNSLATATSLIGVRAQLREEFSSIYVINLKGNAYTQGDEFKEEGR